MAEVAIIGAGPAGLATAIYLGRAGFSPLVFEGLTVGGNLSSISLLENYPGFPKGIEGFNFAFSLQEQAEKFGAKLIYERVRALKPISAEENNSSTAEQPGLSSEVAEERVEESYPSAGKQPGLSSEVAKEEVEESRSSAGKQPRYRIETSAKSYDVLCVCIATGTKPRKLPRVDLSPLEGRGVSYCATCDGNFFAGREVALVGGGDTACAEALYLSRLASRVHLIHRRDSLRANHWYQEQVLHNDKITLHWNSEVVGYQEKEGRLAGITLETKPGFTAGGSFDPEPSSLVPSDSVPSSLASVDVEQPKTSASHSADTSAPSDPAPSGSASSDPAPFSSVSDSVPSEPPPSAFASFNCTSEPQTSTLACAGLFVAIGSLPQTEWLEGISKDNQGYLITNNECETSLPGVFAVGDVRQTTLRQVVTAVSDGAIAAQAAVKFLATC